jgi:1,2-diacylglycerol 3-beta-glucosyltransferase
MLVGLLVTILLIMLVTERWLPQFSGASLVYGFIIAYTGLQSLAQAHRKRKEIKASRLNAAVLPAAMQSTQPVSAVAELPVLTVAMVVPCHNEVTVITQTVHQLMQCQYPGAMLWVVDDRSTDDTATALAQLQQQYDQSHPGRFFWFSRHPSSTPGKSAVLNDARQRVGTVDVMAVFDADARVEPTVLGQLMPFLHDDRVGAVQARKTMFNAQQNLLTRCQQYEYCLDAHFQSGRDVVHGAVELRGNGQLVKTRALDSIGGWNEATVTDDLDLSTQLHLAGWDVRFAHKIIVAEEAIPQFLPLLRQRRRWAEGSLVRYLSYSGKLVSSPHVSLRATVDMIAWFTQFLLPVWLLMDYVVLGIDLLMGNANNIHLISSILLLPLLSAFFTSSLFVGILRFAKTGWWHALQWACITGTYMTVVWVPIVFWVLLRMLFRQGNTLDWGKTQHGTGARAPVANPQARVSSPSASS